MSGCCGQGPVIISGTQAAPRVDVEAVLLCDVLPDGSVAGVALVEPVYDTVSGDRVGTRVVDPATGDPYTPSGTLAPCAGSGCASMATQVLCDDTGPFIRAIVTGCDGEVTGAVDLTLAGAPYTAVGEVGPCPVTMAEECASPTEPVATVGLCLADGTPIAVTVQRDCDGVITSQGWINLATGVFSAGQPPAGTVACGPSQSIEVSGTFCDVDGDGQVVGLVLIEYSYDSEGVIDSVRLVDATTGTTYVPTGTITVCPAGVAQPEKDLVRLCDVAGDGTVTPFVRDYARDENGQITGFSDYTLAGAPYTPTGTVGVCGPGDCPTTSVQTVRLCDLNPDAEPDEEGRRCAIPFLRHLAFGCSGEVIGFRDTGLDGTTPYMPVQVVDCQCETGQGVTSSIEVPWQVVSVVEDPAGAVGQDFIYTVAPETDPTRLGTIHVHVSRPAGGACGPYDINNLIFSNSATYTLTLDAVAQEMSYLRVDLQDFDTFEPVGISGGTPEPTRLGGTAQWNAAHTRIVPAENNGTGYMYWDNPPETIGWTVFNQGGGTSCSALSFQGMTVEPGGCCGGSGTTSSCSDCETVALCDVPADGDPIPFLRHICRDCEGTVTSVTDTTLDATTPYTPTAVVTDCGAVKDCPSTYGTECWELVTAQAAYNNTNTSGASCGTITPDMGQCAGTYRINSWVVDGVERVVGTPPQFVAVGCGDNANQLHGAWAAALAALDPGTDWEPAYNDVCLWHVRTSSANPDTVYGTMILERIAGGPPAVYTLGSAQSSSREVYTKTFVQECDGTTTFQWFDADGNEIDEPVGELTSCGSSTILASPTEPDEATPVGTAIRRLTGAGAFDADSLGVPQSVTVMVLAGSATVATSDGTAEVPAGVSLSWSVATDQDSAVAALTVTTDAADDVLVTATYK